MNKEYRAYYLRKQNKYELQENIFFIDNYSTPRSKKVIALLANKIAL